MALILSRRAVACSETLYKLGHITAQTYRQKCLHTKTSFCSTQSLIKTLMKPSRKQSKGLCAIFKCDDQRHGVSSMQVDHTVSSAKQVVDPFELVQEDMECIIEDIRKELRANTNQPNLQLIATYYFDGQGKAVRPMVTTLMARAINSHLSGQDSSLLTSQREVAMISEMIHSASLIHDDVIDQSDCRRGKPSVNVLWNPQQVAMAGDFILAVTCMMISRLRDDEVTIVLSQIVSDLVRGEFMQLGSKLTINDRFAHYLSKSYRKTASLIANTAKATALLAGANQEIVDIAFQYGRNIGIAFQLVDDMLDFVSSSDAMGKPTAVDLKLGLATAPVLFACEKYPQLNLMILRRFEGAGDVESAFELVHKSQGLEETQILARKYCLEAVRYAKMLEDSPYQRGLQVVSDLILHRLK